MLFSPSLLYFPPFFSISYYAMVFPGRLQIKICGYSLQKKLRK
jgi:hypothetical protein